MHTLYEPIEFARGLRMKNRFALAPLTNSQSHIDGSLSEEEFRWLTMRARGGFGLTMTCASLVQASAQSFDGQLAAFDQRHDAGLARLANSIRDNDSLAILQLYHAGMRARPDLTGVQAVSPSGVEKYQARAMRRSEIQQLVDDFVAAARRAEACGFEGVEIHGAHGYLLCEFLSPEINQRTDDYGGSLENRTRIFFDIIRGVRDACSDSFSIGLRISPERFGLLLEEMIEFAQQVMDLQQLDYLDLSLWDAFKEPASEKFAGYSLLSYFTQLNRGRTLIAAAGKISHPHHVTRALDEGADFVMLGRVAILHHDYPKQMCANPNFEPTTLPVTRNYLRSEGLGDAFIDYMSTWAGFVVD